MRVYILTGVLGFALLTWLFRQSEAQERCQDQEKDRLAGEYARAAVADAKLCLSGVATDRFDPAVYCGDDITLDQHKRFYRRLLDGETMLYPTCDAAQ
jgi:hypothetical protein